MHTFFKQDMVEAVVEPVTTGSVASFSARCPGKETPNEDAAAIISINSTSGVLVVADGMGGCRGGEQASQIAVRGSRPR